MKIGSIHSLLARGLPALARLPKNLFDTLPQHVPVAAIVHKALARRGVPIIGDDLLNVCASLGPTSARFIEMNRFANPLN